MPTAGEGAASAETERPVMVPDTVDGFVGLVREYLALLDPTQAPDPVRVLPRCALLLPRIYAAGVALPQTEPLRPTLSEREVVAPREWLAKVVGRHDLYFRVLDPYDDPETLVGSVVDELADIYRALARALRDYEAGQVAEAVAAWRLGMQGFCGDHVVGAMQALHRLVHDRLAA